MDGWMDRWIINLYMFRANLLLIIRRINSVSINSNWYKVKKGKGKVYPCTGTEALYRPYGP